MTNHASGLFEVKLTPREPAEGVGDSSVGRMGIAKQFSGGLEAVSRGQMLTAMTDVEGSAGYVAIERVTGTHFRMPFFPRRLLKLSLLRSMRGPVSRL